MLINLHPQVSFKQGLPILQKVQQVPNEAKSVEVNLGAVKADTVEKTLPPPPVVQKQELEKKSFASKILSAWVNTSELVGGLIGGAFSAFMVGTLLAGADLLHSGITKKAEWKDIFKTPTKMLGTVGKYFAPGVAGIIFADHMIKAKMSANEKTSKIKN